MRRPTRRTVVSLAIPLVLVVLLVLSWAVDTSDSAGRTLPNVSIGGLTAGGKDRSQVEAVVRAAAAEFAATPVEIDTTGQTFQATAGQLGLVIDEPATVAAALALGHHDPLVERPLEWLASFAQRRAAPLRYSVEIDRMALELIDLEGGTSGLLPVEPSIVGSPETVGVQGGFSGHALDAAAVGSALVHAAEQGRSPLAISAEPMATDPTVSNAAAEALAAILTVQTSAGIDVIAGGSTAVVPAATLRGWLGSRVEHAKLVPTIDDQRATHDLGALLTGLGGKARNAQFTVVHGEPKIVPSTNATACCAAGTGPAVLAAIEAGKTTVTVPLTMTHPSFTTADAQRLGIIEAVGTTTVWDGQPQVKSFTTYYPPGTPQMTNIHRIADLVRGSIVKPGATFSVDDRVGPRSTARGFVAAAADDGDDVDAVGGGVSYFATALFNAAFFAGLDFGAYQPHPVQLPQYPPGREATLGFPGPDLQIRDTTPYGLLIWPTYTAGSITVTIYSTQSVFGLQTAQTSAPDGACTRVTTTRTRTFVDGHTTTDQFFADYRPSLASTC